MTKIFDRLATVLTTVALTLVATVATPLTTRAETHPHTKNTIRHATLDRCKVLTQHACGPWRLTLRNGKQIILHDAQVNARSKKGKPIRTEMAAIAISGNGRRVAYIRANDHRIVVRDLGGDVYVMPREALPTRADNVALQLSDNGTHLAVNTQIFNVDRAVKLAKLPGTGTTGVLDRAPTDGKASFEGFSGDGDEALTVRSLKGDRLELISYSLRGEVLARATLKSEIPPSFLGYAPLALGADGRSVAHLTATAGKDAVEIIDLTTGRRIRNVKVKVPEYGYQAVFATDWITADKLTVHIQEELLTTPSPIRVLEINLTTGKITTRERYEFRDNVFGYRACGG
ncbi:hypothetical protein [Rhizohabitans arisaemae]|uniref:hypothetical protein n=1 Tax=Rhizohabitans arisaemae TaxID=2720610 RepID=UPI0024B1E0A1|nr:hypothetical protein [Rhizohabitans arisaemae]